MGSIIFGWLKKISQGTLDPRVFKTIDRVHVYFLNFCFTYWLGLKSFKYSIVLFHSHFLSIYVFNSVLFLSLVEWIF